MPTNEELYKLLNTPAIVDTIEDPLVSKEKIAFTKMVSPNIVKPETIKQVVKPKVIIKDTPVVAVEQPTAEELKKEGDDFKAREAMKNPLISQLFNELTSQEEKDKVDNLLSKIEAASNRELTKGQVIGASVKGLGQSLAYGINKNWRIDPGMIDDYFKQIEDRNKIEVQQSKDLLKELLDTQNKKRDDLIKLYDAKDHPKTLAERIEEVEALEKIKAKYAKPSASDKKAERDMLKEERMTRDYGDRASGLLNSYQASTGLNANDLKSKLSTPEGEESFRNYLETAIATGKIPEVKEKGMLRDYEKFAINSKTSLNFKIPENITSSDVVDRAISKAKLKLGIINSATDAVKAQAMSYDDVWSRVPKADKDKYDQAIKALKDNPNNKDAATWLSGFKSHWGI